MRSHLSRVMYAGLLGSISTWTIPAVAAQTTNDPDAIIVTAQRRAERLEEVPMSVIAASQEMLEKSGITNMHDLDQLAPGVKITFTGAFTQPAIRGITTLTSGSGFENNVAIYIDGFYSPDTVSINTDLVNVSDVQILKGPQGALYGRNATGGAIVINTLAPSDVLTAKGQLSFARFNELMASAYVAGPITSGLRASIAANYRTSDGHYKYVDPNGSGDLFGKAAPQKQMSVRGKLEADISPDIEATVGLNYGYSDDPTTLLFPNQGHAPSYLPKYPFAGSAPGEASTTIPTQNIAKVREATGKLIFNTGIGSITSYTGYAYRTSDYQYDFDGTYAPFLESVAVWSQKTFQQAVDFDIDAGDRLDLIVGASYFNDKSVNEGSSTILGGSVVSLSFADMKTEAWAAYADGTYEIADSLFVNVGARYSHEKKSIKNRQTDPTGMIDYVIPGKGDTDFSAFTPRATIRYEFAPSTSAYVSATRGFRSGGFQPTPVADPAFVVPFRPEKITAFEVGFKTAQSFYRFDVAAYYYDYTDLQVGQTVVNPVGQNLINIVSNAKKAEVYGVDLMATLFPVEGLTLRGGVSLLHARYKDYPDAENTSLDPVTGLNISEVVDWGGLRMSRAPDISGTFGADYQTAFAEGSLNLSVSGSFNSRYPQSNPSVFGPLNGDRARKQRYENDSDVIVNAQIAWTDPSDHMTLSVFGTNLTNTRYFLNYGGTPYFGDIGVYNRPRSYGVKLAFQY